MLRNSGVPRLAIQLMPADAEHAHGVSTCCPLETGKWWGFSTAAGRTCTDMNAENFYAATRKQQVAI